MFHKVPALKCLGRSIAQSGRRCLTSRAMPSTQASLQAVVAKLNEFAPESLAEKWDNVGLLVEPFPERPIRNILLTIDLTERVMQEAMEKSTDLIISYHPPIFAPLKRITQKSWKERIINHCLRNGIAVYSPHTSWDSVTNGVNDWLANALPLASSQPILENLSNPSYGGGRICVVKGELTLQEAVQRIKQHTKLEHVMVGVAPGASGRIQTFAVCAGSGASVLKGVKADLYVTGEMSHHEYLEAKHQDTNLILLGHCNSERGFLPVFKGILSDLLQGFSDVTINVSEQDGDPMQLVHTDTPTLSN
ncbi:NIF3-like protein 1 [Anopheles ziemanni]|uniref:NIF3-like protein 1 n=1 Tax=Anopheles coustani TaxID=139045 RepID=UPI00265B53EA|nr:NIF3-like protein 1 [Anopheles coustani]XP_058176038.1 NIF3-like protein 1 [Anopheles ziemanni]